MTRRLIKTRRNKSGYRFNLWTSFVVLTLLATLLAIGRWLVTAKAQRAKLAWETRNLVHLADLQQAVEAFRLIYGEYPPGDNMQSIKEHFARELIESENYTAELSDRGLDLRTLDPSEALVLWLGGISPPDGSRQLIAIPLQTRQSPRRYRPTFVFEAGKLTDVDQDGWLEYIDPRDGGNTVFQLRGHEAVAFDRSSGRLKSVTTLSAKLNRG